MTLLTRQTFGVAVDFVGATFLLAKASLQFLLCHIESDPVPELKRVDDSFRGRIDADRDAVDLMVFKSFSQRRPERRTILSEGEARAGVRAPLPRAAIRPRRGSGS